MLFKNTYRIEMFHFIYLIMLKYKNKKKNMQEEFEDTNKGNNKITELRTILQRESQNS